uniref:DUF5060 domain-containing protein n=1 Tax=uncultured Draconibacterium sp. TaxID=1573823 RepID=UPI0032177AEE
MVVLIAGLFQLIYGCSKNEEVVKEPETEEETFPVKWKVTEIEFTSSNSYSNSFNDLDLDVVFRHSGGTEIKVPAFWSSGKKWMVRFAPTLTGKWTYKTVCTDEGNSGLHNQTGEIDVEAYNGDLEIYTRGFVKTEASKRYFSYNDGSPFFYLGDTHWNMPVNTLENFKTIVDKRVEQGFTVIQSEPIGAGYNLQDGVTEGDLHFFSKLDERFKYIAAKGLVHANAQLFFVAELGSNRNIYTDEYLEKLCRYWVARYSAFPVMWTTAQECDNDFYRERGDHDFFDASTNPWKLVAGYINKYDPYKHPLSAHMEHTSFTIASQSAFRDLPGHTWFAPQWSPIRNGLLNFDIPKDFWLNGQEKPVVNYEGFYDHLWTNEFGARMQGWTAFLNGMFGHGYGAIDIWLYNSTYDMDKPSILHGITVTVADKQTKWTESLEFKSAYQMGYMREFFNAIDWWKLTPRFDDADWYRNDGAWYSLATINSDVYVVYFYNNINKKTGTLKNMENTAYSVQWFNPVTGESEADSEITIKDGTYTIGDKPSIRDWVLLVRKK